MMLALKNLEVAAKIVPIDTVKRTNVTLDFPYKKLPTVTLEYEGKYTFKDEPLEIEDAFEKTFEPSLRVDSKEINTFVNIGAGSTFYHKFNQFIKNQDPSADPILAEHLVAELKKVNGFLLSEKIPKNENGERELLGGSDPKIPDCYLLPKLHYTYVALAYVKECPFDSLAGIDAYLEYGRKHLAFANTCPAKVDIVDFYCRQANMSAKKNAEILRKVQKEDV